MWKNLRDQYVKERSEELRNSSTEKSEFLKQYGDHMSFLENSTDCWSKILSDERTRSDNDKNDENIGTPDPDPSIDGPSNVDKVLSQNTNSSDILVIDEDGAEVVEISDEESPPPESKMKVTLGVKRPASECDNTIFIRTIEAKLLKMNSTQKEQFKKEVFKILKLVKN